MIVWQLVVQDLHSSAHSVRSVCTVVVAGLCSTGMDGEGAVVNLVIRSDYS